MKRYTLKVFTDGEKGIDAEMVEDEYGPWVMRRHQETEISNLRESLREALIEIEGNLEQKYGGPDLSYNKGTNRDFKHAWAEEIRLSKDEEVTG